VPVLVIFLFFRFSVTPKNDCACIVSTVSKLSRLWENKDKQEYHEKQRLQQEHSNASKSASTNMPPSNSPYPVGIGCYGYGGGLTTYHQLGMTSYPTHLPSDRQDSDSCSGTKFRPLAPTFLHWNRTLHFFTPPLPLSTHRLRHFRTQVDSDISTFQLFSPLTSLWLFSTQKSCVDPSAPR